MKRFLSFLLFVLVLSAAVGALQIWKANHGGAPLPGRLGRFFGAPDETTHRPEKYTVAAGPRIDLKEVDVLAAMSAQRVLLARAVIPSVVSITTTKTTPPPELSTKDPLFQFFHRGRRGFATPQKALGSGAIVSREGHIITNNHVVEGMDDIEVELSDGRTRKAQIIGADPATDLAVLKIDASDVQPLPFGDSDAVEVGESVMAVGNPYGLEESVSQGIISAKGRSNEMLSDQFNLLQTDAAINPGNSGGPLVNIRGELIGINEAIFSQTGLGQGVGFAIPSGAVRRTMDEILKTGRAMHGYLGVNLRALTTEAAQEFGLPDSQGALVTAVMPDSPAARAQLQQGDFIRKFNNKPISDVQDLRRRVAAVPVDSTVSLELLRRGRLVTVEAKINERPAEAQLSRAAGGEDGR